MTEHDQANRGGPLLQDGQDLRFQLADAFVMDVCLANDQWKIVECGCINAAGFYNVDMQKVIVAIEEKFN